MADFINTVDRLGDETVFRSLIDRSITEYKDNHITTIGANAFHSCVSLTTVDIPNVDDIPSGAFNGCSALKNFNFDSITSVGNVAFSGTFDGVDLYWPNNMSLTYNAFAGCKMRTLYAPKQQYLPLQGVQNCSNLVKVVLPECTSLDNNCLGVTPNLEYLDVLGGQIFGNFFKASTKFKIFILRTTSSPSTLHGDTLGYTMIGNGSGYIYVPRALIEDYKVATNWSAYADQFRPLEDYTLDGTVTGVFAWFKVVYSLTRVASSNRDMDIEKTYTTILTSRSGEPISEVIITMGGIDITDSVYNPETGEVSIDLVTGDIIITATAPMGETVYTMLYQLPEPKTFNGTSDYIDTGIKLFDTAKDFTIICVADFTKLDNAQKCLFHCMNEASPYPGLSVDGSGGVRLCYTGSSSIVQTISNRNDVKALAFRYKAGVLDAIRYLNAAGEVVTFAHNASAKYTAVSLNLLLGAYQTTSGSKGRYYNGTISRFSVYDGALEDEDMAYELTNS